MSGIVNATDVNDIVIIMKTADRMSIFEISDLIDYYIAKNDQDALLLIFKNIQLFESYIVSLMRRKLEVNKEIMNALESKIQLKVEEESKATE